MVLCHRLSFFLKRGESWQSRYRTTGDREDYRLCEGEGRLRHLLFGTSVVALLADVCIHFSQDGHEVNTPAGEIKGEVLPHFQIAGNFTDVTFLKEEEPIYHLLTSAPWQPGFGTVIEYTMFHLPSL